MKIFSRRPGDPKPIDLGICSLSNYPVLLPTINEKRDAGIILTFTNDHYSNNRAFTSDRDIIQRVLSYCGYGATVRLFATKGVPNGTVSYLSGSADMLFIRRLDMLSARNVERFNPNNYFYVRDIATGQMIKTHL